MADVDELRREILMIVTVILILSFWFESGDTGGDTLPFPSG